MKGDIASTSGVPSWFDIYSSSLLAAGLTCMVLLAMRYIRKPRNERKGKVAAWKVSATDFGLFIWLMFMCVLISGMISNLILDKPETSADTAIWQTILTAFLMQGGMLLVFAAYLKHQPELFSHPINTIRLGAFQTLPMALFVLLAAMPVVMFAGYIWQLIILQLNASGFHLPTSPQLPVELFSQSLPLTARIAFVLLATVTAPIVEELIFRGFIYRFLKGKIPSLAAMVVSGAAFGAIHFNFVGFVPLTILGVFLCLSYELSGNIKTPILFHALFNAHSLALISLAPDSLLKSAEYPASILLP